jgi:hypothetical protein
MRALVAETLHRRLMEARVYARRCDLQFSPATVHRSVQSSVYGMQSIASRDPSVGLFGLGLTEAEAAAGLGCHRNTAHTNLSRAVKELRDVFRKVLTKSGLSMLYVNVGK